MGKVISLKSRMQLGGSDFKENDELVSKKGFYIGVLTESLTKELRAMQNMLEAEQIKINQLTEEYTYGYNEYISKINYVLLKYNHIVKSYNPEIEALCIGEDGHMWLIKHDDIKSNN